MALNIEHCEYESIVKMKNKIIAKSIFNGFLDDRARSVDLICLIILLELFYSFNISWIIFLLILFKHFILFIVSFYKVGKGGWVENITSQKLR